MPASNSCSRSRSLVALTLLAASLLACKAAPRASSAPERDYSSSPEQADGLGEDAPAEDPLAELERLEQQMRALDLPVARDSAPGAGEGAGGEAVGGASLDGEAEAAPAEEDFAPEPSAATRAERKQDAQGCELVCDLSVAICDLEQQICSLSAAHGDDPTYANACRRAADDCEVAGYECDRCAG